MSSLLTPDEPAPVAVQNPDGASAILFVSDHAGRRIPRRLGTLGLDEKDLRRHIAWDIGIEGVTRRLAERLDAAYITQPYSRLVIDCNRRPGMAQSIMAVSDGTPIPGNRDLSPAEITARENDILRPYHATIERALDNRLSRGQASLLWAMHSCTPVFGNEAPRPWHIGVIAHTDWRLGDALLDLFAKETDLCVGRNKPYSINFEMDYTIPIHAEGRGLPYVEIEIRQDLIEDEAGQREFADIFANLLPRTVAHSGVLGT